MITRLNTSSFQGAQDVKSLKVKCDSGCKWIGELRSLEEHSKSCDKALVHCPNRCDTGNQRVKISRKNLKKHLTKTCPRRKHLCQYCGQVGEHREITKIHLLKCTKRPYPCQYCGQIGQYKERIEVHVFQCQRRPYTCPHCLEVGEYRERTTHLHKCSRRQHACQYCGQYGEFLEMTTTHVQDCPRLTIPCPNECGETFLRLQEKEHRLNCKYETVECKYKEIGCGVTKYRKDIPTHEEEHLLHLNLAIKTILTLSTAIVELENKQIIASSDIKPSRFVFEVREFNKYKSSGDKFYSAPFNTHNGGYKMCTVIIIDGCGDSKGSHVAVAACLMKGDNDDSLTWPFTGSVTFELLNQLADVNHHTYTTPSFPANKTRVSGRVLEGERGTGLGKNNFIPHTELDYNPDKNCQYLRYSDDKLVFRVSVEVPDRRPWLECTV